MGILYTVWPLDTQAQEWLRSQEIPFPSGSSRWPTRKEIQNTLSALRGFKVEYTDNGPGKRWDAFVSDEEEDGNWTLLHAEPQEDDECTHLHFEKGEPTLVVAIMRSLSEITGPFMLLPDIGCPPMVVSMSQSVVDTVSDFCEVDQDSPKWQRLVLGAPGASPVQ
ncbi:MAG: hypothetical protein KF892_23655 [Rhizobacter sp.]|nr:hypothetical protein [Rhizobacter sp.]